MSIGKIVSKLAPMLKNLTKVAGKQSILKTKSQSLKNVNIAELKIAKNLESDLLEIGQNKFFSRIFGRPVQIKNIKRRNMDANWVKLPEKYAGFDDSIDASTYAMSITRKGRTIALAKTNPVIAKNIKEKPHLVTLTEEEIISKKVLDKAFNKVTPNNYDSVEYRGVVLNQTNPTLKQILNFKKGDIYIEPGYIWTTPDQNYAFGRYAAKPTVVPSTSIKYNILMPKGSKMLCADRLKPETLLPYNSKFKVFDIKKDIDGNIELFLENLI